MIGRVHRDRYYSTDIGYDPGSARWSVGNVLHAEVVRDLIATKAATLFAAASATRSGRKSTSTSTARLLETFGMKSKLRKWIRHIAPARHVRDEVEPRPAVEGTGR
jgi:coenzyme F420-reducing hydrogenase alpha subunit